MATIPSWISVQPDAFIKASEAGASLGLKIAEMTQRGQIENARLAAAEANRPRGGFGLAGPLRAMTQPEAAPAVNPNAPSIGGIPGSPMLIDPQRENQTPKINAPFSLPGDVSGRQFVTTDSGNVAEYTPPPTPAEKMVIRGTPGEDGVFGIGETSGEVRNLIPSIPRIEPERVFNVPVSQSKSGAAITMPMTASQLEAKWPQLSEFGKTNDVTRLIRNLGRDRQVSNQSFQSEDDAREAGSKAGDVVYIQGVGRVRLK